MMLPCAFHMIEAAPRTAERAMRLITAHGIARCDGLVCSTEPLFIPPREKAEVQQHGLAESDSRKVSETPADGCGNSRRVVGDRHTAI